MLVKPLFKGSCVALITPFKDDKINFDELEKLIEFQIKEGTDAIVTLGTTGEPATMTEDEKKEVVDFTVKTVNNRIPVIAGAGGNNTNKVISCSKQFEDLGADGLLLVTPYYNKCTQGGLVKHFKSVADNTKLPIILYNVPSRTGVNILPSTIKELKGYKSIYAIKEASGNFEQICDMLSLCNDNEFVFYSGDDGVTYPTMAMGGYGVISVTANIIPKYMKQMTKCYFDGEYEKAKNMHFKLLPLVKACFSEVNPIPVKAAAKLMGLCGGDLRLPLTDITEENKLKLISKMQNFGIEI